MIQEGRARINEAEANSRAHEHAMNIMDGFITHTNIREYFLDYARLLADPARNGGAIQLGRLVPEQLPQAHNMDN